MPKNATHSPNMPASGTASTCSNQVTSQGANLKCLVHKCAITTFQRFKRTSQLIGLCTPGQHPHSCQPAGGGPQQREQQTAGWADPAWRESQWLADLLRILSPNFFHLRQHMHLYAGKLLCLLVHVLMEGQPQDSPTRQTASPRGAPLLLLLPPCPLISQVAE
jgi:hypothetical protein